MRLKKSIFLDKFFFVFFSQTSIVMHYSKNMRINWFLAWVNAINSPPGTPCYKSQPKFSNSQTFFIFISIEMSFPQYGIVIFKMVISSPNVQNLIHYSPEENDQMANIAGYLFSFLTKAMSIYATPNISIDNAAYRKCDINHNFLQLGFGSEKRTAPSYCAGFIVVGSKLIVY